VVEPVKVETGRGYTRTVYPATGPGQEPEDAVREAIIVYMTDLCIFVGFTGVNEGIGLEVPLAGGQLIIPGSHILLQLYTGDSPVTLVCRTMG